MARLPLDGAQEHLPARDNRIAGYWITLLMSCLRPGPWLQSSQLAICFFFQETLGKLWATIASRALPGPICSG
jgi:hypothetical protein